MQLENNLLCICVPTYNRKLELVRFFKSIKPGLPITFVVCDDGSTDGTADVINYYSKIFIIKYLYQVNSGRASALYEAIRNSNSKFTIIMDSDDYFIDDGLEFIIDAINKNASVDAFLFGTVLLKGNRKIFNNPPSAITNYIAIRADHFVKYDLKEVVKTRLLQKCNIKPRLGCRRVPTYLLWSCIALDHSCMSFSKAVVIKEYLPGGMSAKIHQLKIEYPEPMADLYYRLSNANVYKSKLYRWRCRILWSRYALQCSRYRFNTIWSFVVLLPGLILFFVDILKVCIRK